MNKEVSSKLKPFNRVSARVDFWPGASAQIDLEQLVEDAIPVKGYSYHSPLRFLEIFANGQCARKSACPSRPFPSWSEIQRLFFPKIPGVRISFGGGEPQPPFAWRDADARFLALSFTYNTNAFFRIFSTLCSRGLLTPQDVDRLVDRACEVLSHLYKANCHFLMKNINNNFNMYLISKVVEFLVGKRCYDAESQELLSTRRSLSQALIMSQEYNNLPIVEKMGVALGKGVSFMESRMRNEKLDRAQATSVQKTSYQFYHKRIAVDHRLKLLELVSESGLRKNSFNLAVILDDATETVDDLLWLQDLLEMFPFLRVHILVNTAQISINFSSHMLKSVWRARPFAKLVQKLGTQFFVTEIYCPFISFQTNFLPSEARRIIDESDAVYIKGANFFETCQIPEKDCFHAFVVFGPISQQLTGLNNFDGVFTFLPAGIPGYRHEGKNQIIRTLSDTVNNVAHFSMSSRYYHQTEQKYAN